MHKQGVTGRALEKIGGFPKAPEKPQKKKIAPVKAQHIEKAEVDLSEKEEET